jgi:hypothetical protein
MAKIDYTKYIIQDPKLIKDMAFHGYDQDKLTGFTFPVEVYAGKGLLKEANTYMNLCWIWEIPNPAVQPGSHSHDFDELVLFIGSNPRDQKDFQAEIEWHFGTGAEDQKFIFNTTTLVYVPRGLVHGPVTYLRVDKPVLNIAIGLNTQNYG